MSEKAPTHESIKKTIKRSGTAIAAPLFLFFILLGANADAIAYIVLLAGISYWVYVRLQVNKWDKNPEVKPILDAVREEMKEERSQAKQTKSLLVKYEVGLEHLNLSGSYNISSAQTGLQLKRTFGKDVVLIPWSDLIEVEAGSEADLRSRVTVSRLLLTGIFAFGLKKERKKGFFISVATPNSLGLFQVNTSGSNNRANEKKARVFAAACNARIRSVNPQGVAKAEASSASSYDEIEKLGDLLNKGLLTQKSLMQKRGKYSGYSPLLAHELVAIVAN
jgi:hypothetical protein